MASEAECCLDIGQWSRVPFVIHSSGHLDEVVSPITSLHALRGVVVG